MLNTLLVALLLSCASIVPADNLLVNPGFEAGEDRPSGWNFNHRGTDGIIAWDDGRAAGGERSIRLTNTEGQSGNVLQSLEFEPPLAPGSRVTCRAMSAAENATSAPRIVVYLQPPAGNRQTISAFGLPGTHDFAPVTATVVADRPVARITVYLCHYASGTAWWDDAFLSVERAEETAVIERPAGETPLTALETADGLALVMNDAGGVASVRIDGFDLRAPGMRSGLRVQPARGPMVPVTGEIAAVEGGLRQRWESADLGLRVTSTWSSEDGAIVCRGEVVDLTGEDRGVDLVASLPLGARGEGWLWGQSVVESAPLWDGDDGDEPVALPRALDDLTFSALSRPGEAGISLAVPADSPSVCRFEWDSGFGLLVRFSFGLSPGASGALRSRAPFAFTVSRIDPAWGLRDAARRYQERNPGAFEKRVEREGLWMFGTPRIDLPDPYNYAFREGGPGGWEYDEEHGIGTYPYIIPGQREIKDLDTLPLNAAEALQFFEQWEPGDGPRGRGWGNRPVIETCMLHDADGSPHVVIRSTPWGGNSITFPLNANPWLHADSDRPTIAKLLLEHVERQHDEIPQLDGAYVDSLGAWGNFLNLRREHFAAERVPLTWDRQTGRPAIDNSFTLLEFLWALRDLLHERDRLLFANGVHPNRRFHFFALDILGVEGHGRLEQKRTMAGTKPFLLLIYNIENDPERMEYWFNRCAHWGIYPSFGNMRLFETQEDYAPIADLNERYVPAMQRITAAGWRPVTHAYAGDGAMVERWGPGAGGEVYLTVYPGEATTLEAVELTVDAAALGLGGAALIAEDLLTGDSFEGGITDGSCVLPLPLQTERVKVLRLSAL